VRTTRVTIVLAAALCALAALALPAIASASNWKKNGNELTQTEMQWAREGMPLTSEANVSFGGSFNVAGGLNCEVLGQISLEPGYGTGRVKSFILPGGWCKITGTLQALGCTSVTSATATLPVAYFIGHFAEGKKALSILNNKITYVLAGGESCPKEVVMTGSLKATPDSETAIKSLTFSGELESNVAGVSGAASGSVSILSSIGTFGFMSAEAVNLSGSLDYILASCSANSQIVLDPGSTGKVVSFSLSSCVGKSFWNGCTITSTSANGLPWTARDEGTTVKLEGVNFTATVSCGGGSPGPVKFTGDLNLNPNKASAISSTTISGWLKGASSEWSTSGSLNWSPAAVFGL